MATCQTLNLIGTDNCATTCSTVVSNGKSITGLNTTDRVNIKLIAGTYTAWNAWGGSVNCAVSTGCPQSGGGQGWMNRFVVCNGTVGSLAYYGDSALVFPTPAYALAAWNAAYPDGLDLTGHANYYFALADNLPADNVGGLSLYICVYPLANAPMFSCNT